jgi:elongation factor G
MTGNHARDIRVCVFDGSMHSVDSNDAAFKTAASHAFKDAFMQSNPQLLEPIYEVSIALPAEFTGSVVSDLSTRRAQIQGMDVEDNMQVVNAHVPLVEIQRYSRQLQSLTQGRAALSMKYNSYQAVPKSVEQRFLTTEMV